jgi:cbb3-type cytochrome oxidase subunit 3
MLSAGLVFFAVILLGMIFLAMMLMVLNQKKK